MFKKEKKNYIFITHSPQETKKIAKNLINFLLKNKTFFLNPKIIFLKGKLGSGKTTFLQGFVAPLKIKEKILSPTFVIIKRFKINKKRCNFTTFYHIDCYRLKNEKEILNLNFKEIISDPKNIVAIEWPEKIKKILPQKGIKIYFQILDLKRRKIKIKFNV
jgi:tRNA threonylcarbamoyladenosine biosynthesis protein TsaE